MALTNKTAFLRGTLLSDDTTNFNALSTSSASALAVQFNSDQELDSSFFSWSSGNKTRLVFDVGGDYLISFGLPLTSNGSSSADRSDITQELRLNGTLITGGYSDSSYIRNSSGHQESSNRSTAVALSVTAGDYVEAYVYRGSTDTTNTITSDGHALYAERISNEVVFAATGTRTTNSTNLNQSTAYAMQWSSDARKDSGFTHSTSTSSENITLDAAGSYLVFCNIPLSTAVVRGNISGKVLLDGTQVNGGQFQQGMVRNTQSITTGSCHYAGLVTTSSTNQVLTITSQLAAASGTITVGSYFANIIIIKLADVTGVYNAEATQVGVANNWNPTSKSTVNWATDNLKDGVYTHSTSTNNHQITVNDAGDYFIAFNTAFNGAVVRANPKATVQINGTDVVGFQSKSGYIRNSGGANSSSDLIIGELVGLSVNDIITISMQAEAATGTINDDTPASLVIIKKGVANALPNTPTLISPSDTATVLTLTPALTFTTTDSDGDDVVYEIQIDTVNTFDSQ